jgi:hypothetical protein
VAFTVTFRYLDLGLRFSISSAPPEEGDGEIDTTGAGTLAAFTGTGSAARTTIESALSLQDSFAVGSTLIPMALTAPPNPGQLNRNSDAIFAVDFTGLNGNDGTGGRIFEGGGDGTGSYCGFRANGDFVWRTGAGGSSPAAGAVLVVPSTDPNYPTGDGTLVFEGAVSPDAKVRSRAWWNNALIGTVTSVNDQTLWGGSDTGGYLTVAVQGTQPPEEVTTGLVQGTHYTTASALRYYYNQLI